MVGERKKVEEDQERGTMKDKVDGLDLVMNYIWCGWAKMIKLITSWWTRFDVDGLK